MKGPLALSMSSLTTETDESNPSELEIHGDGIQSVHSPGLPRDLDDQIIEEIARGLHDSMDLGRREEVRSRLRDCSLVCRSWLHYTRKHISFIVRESTLFGFVQCLNSPFKILPSTIRRLIMRGITSDYILPVLHDCSLLRSLEISVSIPRSFPELPNLVELTLHRIEFLDWAAFGTFISSFPALETLREFNVVFTKGSADGGYIPELRSVHLSSDSHFMRALATTPHPLLADKLRLQLPARLSERQLQHMSDYLRKLDSRLKYLRVSVPAGWYKFLRVLFSFYD